jgi:NAD(P)H-quinone oxidoreductase subunit 5
MMTLLPPLSGLILGHTAPPVEVASGPLDYWLFVCGSLVVAGPCGLLALLGLSALFSRPLSETNIVRATQLATGIGLLASLTILALMLLTGQRFVSIEWGHWVTLPAEDFHIHVKFVFDRLSVPFVILIFLLTGTIGAFARSYLHRDPGFRRYFLLYAVFLFGMVLSALAGTIETLFIGWELVGLSSALLVAYFHERPAPVRNGLHVWVVYRIADAAFLIAAIVLHHLRGGGEFSQMVGTGLWPEGQAALSSSQAFGVGLLLLVAAAGKSALIPFSGWLPRAMEGPTPSSAIFYGALSVHLGAYLLLRVSPILVCSPALCALIVVLGLATALFAGLAARVQIDIKSALAFASMTQVGLIVAEIGLGWRYLALTHLIGHACLRTLQLLQAPMVLAYHRTIEDALGEAPLQEGAPTVPQRWRWWLYRFAMDRGRLDYLLIEWVARPIRHIFEFCDGLERRWTDFLAGQPSREFSATQAHRDSLEELL